MQNKIILILFVTCLGVFAGGMTLLLKQDISIQTDDNSTGQENESGITVISSTPISKIENTATTSKSDPEIVVNNVLYISKKLPGKMITVDLVLLEEDGFIIVYENTFEPTGELLGESIYLPKGEYQKVPIVLSREVHSGESFDAMLHKDNGDRKFNIQDDEPVRDKSGESVFTRIIIQDIVEQDISI